MSPFGQVLRFGTIGVACTAAYLALFVMLQGLLGAQGANLVALLITAVANTVGQPPVHVRRARPASEPHVISSRDSWSSRSRWASPAERLDALHGLVAEPSRTVEVAMLVLANLAATLIRFVLLRTWVFFGRRAH